MSVGLDEAAGLFLWGHSRLHKGEDGGTNGQRQRDSLVYKNSIFLYERRSQCRRDRRARASNIVHSVPDTCPALPCVVLLLNRKRNRPLCYSLRVRAHGDTSIVIKHEQILPKSGFLVARWEDVTSERTAPSQPSQSPG